jgi:muramoyltetrapeptide carboxypeptidase
MILTPSPLQKGDTIAIVAPAKRIEAKHVTYAKSFLEKAGYNVLVGKHCLGEHYYFSGTIEQRLHDMQEAVDDPSVKAILCARGGYGCVQLVDRIDWSRFVEQPKWVIGFSDVTVFHAHLQAMGCPSIHATMPLNFQENSSEALNTLLKALGSESYSISSPFSPFNVLGNISGNLLGGNLAVLTSLIGTNDQPDFTNGILFVEEVGEPLYSIDRMFYSLQKTGILKQLRGVIVGGMTSLKDSEIPYGSSLEEIVLEHLRDLNIPVCFDFPAGHISDNRALLLGTQATLKVSSSETVLNFDPY